MSSTIASGTELAASDSAPEPLSARRTSYPDSESARRSTSRSARSSSTTSSLTPRLLPLAEHGPEDPVDERGRVGPAEALGGLDRLIDRALRRDRVIAFELVSVQH